MNGTPGLHHRHVVSRTNYGIIYHPLMDVPTKSKQEEYAEDTVQRGKKNVALMDVPTKSKGGVCRRHGAVAKKM